ncbi:hypothetical protein NDU88_001097 [Pleurodeles waltl]|uniref:Uncharacterized protein n=1 Tax=Pleurodeles waltl TaxID=8319 RepID=A0AAV7N9T7_PLEWA|nr:hypothetical protein NDU88_001097 [Pleurodeles waltl]
MKCALPAHVMRPGTHEPRRSPRTSEEGVTPRAGMPCRSSFDLVCVTKRQTRHEGVMSFAKTHFYSRSAEHKATRGCWA